MISTGIVETRVDVATIAAAVTTLYGLTRTPAVGDLAREATVFTDGGAL